MSNRPAALLLLSLCLCCSAAPRRATAQGLVVSVRVGFVTRLEGDAWVRRHGDSGLTRLKTDESLHKGDLLLTGADGYAELTLNPGSYLRVGPLSRVWVHEMEDGLMHFDILRGDVSAIVGGSIDGVTIILDTPPAELNIVKPGHYVVRVAEGGDAEAYVASGELRFSDSDGNRIDLKKHKHVRFKVTGRR